MNINEIVAVTLGIEMILNGLGTGLTVTAILGDWYTSTEILFHQSVMQFV